jgi:hypothetical protein
MIKTAIVALAATALVTTMFASSASAKQKMHHVMATQQQAEVIMGVNPMTNAPVVRPVEHPAPFVHVMGANPM